MKRMLLLSALLAATALCPPAQGGQHRLIAVGDAFPAVHTDHDFTPEERAYLGIERGFFGLFSGRKTAIADIAAELILVEFFNNYCTSCQAQAPALNQAYRAVQKSPSLAGRVRFIGIGAGNSPREVRQFKQRHEVPFPLVPDPRFAFYSAIGEPGGTPFVLILKKRGSEAIVVEVHKGLTKDPSYFIAALTRAAGLDIASLAGQAPQAGEQGDDGRMLRLRLTPKQLRSHVAASMADSCRDCGPVSAPARITTASGAELYTATTQHAGRPLTLYSRIVSQNPVCDVCYGLHYILTFDARGYLRDFHPIHITKYGNVDWNDYDIENMRRRLIGRKLSSELIFEPTLDAVSTATMSSALVFKGFNDLRAVYDELD